MPIGLEIMHWDERIGVEVLSCYPEDMVLAEKTLMQLYSQHEFTGEPGMVSMMAGSSNLASYYTGSDTAIYIVLVLTADEDGDMYEEGLVEISQQVTANLDPTVLKALLPSLFQRLAVYPHLTNEQKLALLLQNEIKRAILFRLRQESTIMKSEIAIWLKDEYKNTVLDIDNILASMVKLGIIKIASVKGISSDVIFFVQDIMALRRPPLRLYNDPEDRHLPGSLKTSYKTSVRNFFSGYRTSDQDNAEIITKIYLDAQCYEVLQLLREAMVTRNDIEKLRKKGVEDVDTVLKAFWETKMIGVFQDETNTEYYCLVSDFYIDCYYPRYNLDTIRNQYLNKMQNPNTLMKALDFMKEEYYNLLETRKRPIKTEEKPLVK